MLVAGLLRLRPVAGGDYFDQLEVGVRGRRRTGALHVTILVAA